MPNVGKGNQSQRLRLKEQKKESIMIDYNAEEKRLQRIEDKIDKLSEAMISLARAEEKLIMMEKNDLDAANKMIRMSKRIDEIEDKVDENSRTVKLINGIAVIVLPAVVAALIKVFLG